MNESLNRYFIKLACHKSWIGQALRTLPDWLIKEASKWPDPWQFLLNVAGLEKSIKDICRAAQSQLRALRRLVQMELGYASRNTNWYQEAMEAKAAGDLGAHNHAMSKVADVLAFYGPQAAALRDQEDPQLLQEARQCQQNRRAQLVHRGEWKDAEVPKAKPGWAQIRQNFPVECYLADKWVNFPGCDLPGLMFWSNVAITELLVAWSGRNQSDLSPDYVQKVRQRLGLIPVDDYSPLVWRVKTRQLKSGGFEIEGRGHNGSLVFHDRLATKVQALSVA